MPSPERKKGKKVTYQDYLTWPDEERADANIQGTPDLIVEIASPSTKLMDKRDKKALYEKFGVKEYVIFYPDDALVERFRMEGGKFEGPDVINWDERWISFAFPVLEISLWEIFGKGAPAR